MQANFRPFRADGHEPLSDRLRAHEEERRQAKHSLRERPVRGLVQVDLRVGAMEADHDRQIANFQQGQQMDADVPEIDVQDSRLRGVQRGKEAARFRPIDGDGPAEELLLHEAPELMGPWLRQHDDRLEGELRGVFAFLAKNHRPERTEGADLSIEVEHLRLEESDHVLRSDGEFDLGHGSGRAVVTRHSQGSIYVARLMRREVKIVNELGLHARPAAEFVRMVQSFKSEITIRKGDEHFVAASILEVLTANLDYGAIMVLEAIGPDAEKALDCLEQLLSEFREQELRGAM